MRKQPLAVRVIEAAIEQQFSGVFKRRFAAPQIRIADRAKNEMMPDGQNAARHAGNIPAVGE
jgi:hypothetical protein